MRLLAELDRLRGLSNEMTSCSRINSGRSLRNLERNPEVWDRYETFEELLLANNLGWDLDVYRRFCLAEDQIGKRVVDSIGFWAATRVVEFDPDLHGILVDELQTLAEERGVFPTYQKVDRWLRDQHPELLEPQKPSLPEKLRYELNLYKKAYNRLRAEKDQVQAKYDQLISQLRTLTQQ